MTDEIMLTQVKKMYIKTNEVMSLMKDGKIIVAYEKLGGVLKNLNSLGVELQKKGSGNDSTVYTEFSKEIA